MGRVRRERPNREINTSFARTHTPHTSISTFLHEKLSTFVDWFPFYFFFECVFMRFILKFTICALIWRKRVASRDTFANSSEWPDCSKKKNNNNNTSNQIDAEIYFKSFLFAVDFVFIFVGTASQQTIVSRYESTASPTADDGHRLGQLGCGACAFYHQLNFTLSYDATIRTTYTILKW